MGERTFTELVDAGLNLAGDTNLTTQARIWLKAWLKSTYTAWPWPFLQRRVTGVALAAGTQSLSLGLGSNGVTPAIKRILDTIKYYNTDRTIRGEARVKTLTGPGFWDDETTLDSAATRGHPQTFKVRADTALYGKWTLIPFPVPSDALLLAIDYLEIPVEISTYTNVPIYPNDQTMIQAVATQALFHMNDERYSEAQDILGAMVINDRIKFGEVLGTNDHTGLDSGIFK